jgi:hypothetical protein
MARRTRSNSLSVYWSKRENDVMFNYPDGPQTKTDGHLLHVRFNSPWRWHDGQESPDLVKELESRGYDVKTLRFSVMKDPNHPRWATPSPSDVEKKE